MPRDQNADFRISFRLFISYSLIPCFLASKETNYFSCLLILYILLQRASILSATNPRARNLSQWLQGTSQGRQHWHGAAGPVFLDMPYEIRQATYPWLHFYLFFSPLCLVYSGYKHKETGTSLTISISKASKSGLLFTWSQCSAGIQLKIQNKTHHYYICENCSFFLHPSYSQLQYLLKQEDSREPFNPSLPFDKLKNYVMWHAGCIHVC